MFISGWGMGGRMIFSSKTRQTENNTVIIISDVRKYLILTFNLVFILQYTKYFHVYDFI